MKVGNKLNKLGNKIKTCGLSLWTKIRLGFMFLVSLGMGTFLFVMSKIRSDIEGSDKITLIGLGLMLSSLVFIIRYFQESKLAGKYTFFTEGFINEITKSEVRYADIEDYYYSFFKVIKEDSSYLVIKDKKGINIINSKLQNGFDTFLENYIPYIIPKEIEKIKNGNAKEFGVMSKIDIAKSKISLTQENTIEKLKNVKEIQKIIVSNQGLIIDEKRYSWHEIKESKITKLNTFVIKDIENEKIFENLSIAIKNIEILEILINEFLKNRS